LVVVVVMVLLLVMTRDEELEDVSDWDDDDDDRRGTRRARDSVAVTTATGMDAAEPSSKRRISSRLVAKSIAMTGHDSNKRAKGVEEERHVGFGDGDDDDIT
jgi:hypothetical protein